jgi:hypothetical protein
MDPKFRKDTVSVSYGSFEGDPESGCDLFAGETRDEKPHDIHFEIGESKRIYRARRAGVRHKFRLSKLSEMG